MENGHKDLDVNDLFKGDNEAEGRARAVILSVSLLRTPAERILEEGEYIIPSVRELKERGVDVVQLADAFMSGLDAEEYGKALSNGFRPEMYRELLEEFDIDAEGMASINEVLKRFNQREEAAAGN